MLVLGFSVKAHAQLEITIGQGTVRGMPIAIVPFKVMDGRVMIQQVHEIVSNDLRASGKFDPLDSSEFLSFPSRNEEVRFKDWRFIDAEALVIGEIQPIGNQYEISVFAYDVAREQVLGGFRFTANDAQLRGVAHEISDFVYKALTGRPGAYSSRIAYVKRDRIEYERYKFRLMVADWDGYNPVEVFSSWNPVLSPSWSPDGKKLAFVSYNDAGPIVRVLDVLSGQSEVVASFPGVNAAPAWSPDGTKLAYSTSKNGSPDVWVYDLFTRQHTRITTHYAIDTEPSWSSDGMRIIFTSNRTRKPQIYQNDLRTGQTSRVTYEGDENASASFDFDDQRMVMVNEGGRIAITNTDGSGFKLLTNAKFDESPSFSPNGDMVLYSTELDYEAVLVVSSSDGRVQTKLEFVSGDVREPAWSPLLNN
jgi:TolB protein